MSRTISSRRSRHNKLHRSHGKIPLGRRLNLESLESREMLATFTVTSTADVFDSGDGVTTLREAIDQSNSLWVSETHKIHFNIPTTDPGYSSTTGTFSIRPNGVLPVLIRPVEIDGWTQPGWTGAPIIELDGTNSGSFGIGLQIGTDNSLVRGFVVNRYEFSGIYVSADGIFGNFAGVNNRLQGNYVGTDVTGTASLGNFNGVTFDLGANNLVGTNGDGIDDALERNIISGNYLGIWLFRPEDTVIAGNYIGTDVSGTAAVPNQRGIATTGLRTRIGSNADGIADVAERNLISGNSSIQVGIGAGGGAILHTVVSGNFIGTDVTGTLPLGGGQGLHIASSENLVGTNGDGVNDPAERNVISGNDLQIFVQGGENNVIAGNFIGTDPSGILAVGGLNPMGWNGGIHVGGTTTRVGTDGNGIADDTEGNIIAGTLGPGLNLSGGGGALVAGNSIGVNALGAPLGNSRDGVVLEFDSNFNQIGGPGPLANRIAHNGGAGVSFNEFSFSHGNAIRQNSIYSNTGLGIDLGHYEKFGVTPNDALDDDDGPNGYQNFPVILSVQGGLQTRVSGTLHSAPDSSFTIDFYANSELDPSGHGEGERWLGSISVTTDASGNAVFDETLAAPSSGGEFVTATATAVNGNTSEFSAAAELLNGAPAADAGGPYSVFEGGIVVLDASASIDPDQTTDSLTFAWDLDGDTLFGETGPDAQRGNELGMRPTFHAVGIDGYMGSLRAVQLRVTDDFGESSTSAADIYIDNAAPEAEDDSSVAGEDVGFIDVDVLANDSDPAGELDLLKITGIDAAGALGILTFTDSTVSYSPNGQFESLALGETATETFTYTITDGDGGTASGAVSITVLGTNDAPVVTELATSHPDACNTAINGVVSVSGQFVDVDLSDIHEVTVDWGDGSATESASVDQLAGTFTGTHTYSAGGVYTVVVTVSDEYGGTDTRSTLAVAQGVGLIDGTLFVIGSNNRDHVNLKFNENPGNVRVDLKLRQDAGGPEISAMYPVTAVDRIVAYLCGGDDHFNGGEEGGSNIAIPTIVFGGAGDDHLSGGKGIDALIGGSGADFLSGGGGRDVLVGGQGQDNIQGDAGEDLLIGGSAAHQSLLSAVDDALTQWNDDSLAGALAALGLISDDGEKDSLNGGADFDTLLGGLGDKLKS